MPRSEPYDLIIIGAGTAGLVTASGAAGLGARVALVERDRLGGECLWTGCVPSKALIASARIRQRMRQADLYGFTPAEPEVTWAELQAQKRAVMAAIEQHDSPDRFRRMGVDVRLAEARFEEPGWVRVGDEGLRYRRALIATGSRTQIPPLSGLEDVGYLTHVEALEAERLPASIAIIGAGPIGLEFAQIYRRLGLAVTLIEQAPYVAGREDQEMARCLEEHLKAEGIRILTCHTATGVRREGTDKVMSLRDEEGRQTEVRTEELFIATGRRPNVEGLGLETVGVETVGRGVLVDRTLRTTGKAIYAAGDVTGESLFTHVAEYQARLVVRNALFPFPGKAEYSSVPWTTFTDPELARVGRTEPEARGQRDDVVVARYPFGELDRALCDREAYGLIKVVATRKGKVLGAHVLGPSAGEVIQPFVLAIRNGISLGELANTIRIYPTLSEGAYRTADRYRKDRFEASRLPGLLEWYLQWWRRLA